MYFSYHTRAEYLTIVKYCIINASGGFVCGKFVQCLIPELLAIKTKNKTKQNKYRIYTTQRIDLYFFRRCTFAYIYILHTIIDRYIIALPYSQFISFRIALTHVPAAYYVYSYNNTYLYDTHEKQTKLVCYMPQTFAAHKINSPQFDHKAYRFDSHITSSQKNLLGSIP